MFPEESRSTRVPGSISWMRVGEPIIREERGEEDRVLWVWWRRRWNIMQARMRRRIRMAVTAMPAMAPVERTWWLGEEVLLLGVVVGRTDGMAITFGDTSFSKVH